MFIATLFTIAQRWKQPMCPPPDKHNVVDYSAIEKKWSSDTYYSMGEPQKHYAR